MRKKHDAVFVGFADEVFQQRLGDIVFGDHTIVKRSERDHIRGRASHHRFGGNANLQRFSGAFINCHPGRFIGNDAFAPDIDQYVRCSKVNSQILRKQAKKPFYWVKESQSLFSVFLFMRILNAIITYVLFGSGPWIIFLHT